MNEKRSISLEEDTAGLYLTDGSLVFRPDPARMIPRIKKGVLGTELLVRAARLKNMSEEPFLIDATAGLGDDSFLLAAAGFRVLLCEYDHIIASLLKDSLRQAMDIPELKDAVSRMEVFEGDSIELMKKSGSGVSDILKTSCGTACSSPSVIYLDPMFPESQKNALIKKKFQLLRQLELPCTNEEELLDAALEAQPHKIVIKRPLKGPFLAGRKPSYSIPGKAVRYDCIVL